MTDRKIHVYVDLDGDLHHVGLLWARSNRGKEGASFQYDSTWLSHPERFALEPALQLTDGAFHTEPDRHIFGSFGDSAPDRWGRIFIFHSLFRALNFFY